MNCKQDIEERVSRARSTVRRGGGGTDRRGERVRRGGVGSAVEIKTNAGNTTSVTEGRYGGRCGGERAKRQGARVIAGRAEVKRTTIKGKEGEGSSV